MAERSHTTPDFCPQLVKKLDDLRKRNKFFDFVLVRGLEEFPIHRVVMMECSSYFEALFNDGWKDSQAKRFEFKVPEKGEFDYLPELRAIIDFIYTGHLEINPGNLKRILQTARFLMVDAAVELCADFLSNSVTPDSYKDMLEIASFHALNGIRRNILVTYLADIANRYEEIFFDLKFEEFAKLLESNWLRPHSEYDVFELVLKWVRYDVANREDKLASLVGCVRLPFMSADELDKVSRSEMVAANTECLQLCAEAANYQNNVSTQPLRQTSQTQVRSDISEFIFSFKDGVKCMNADVRFNPPTGNYSAYVAVVNNFLYLFGKESTGKSWRYDPRFGVWFDLPGEHTPWLDAACVVHNNCIYLIGGSYEGSSTLYTSVSRYSIERGYWDTCRPLPLFLENLAVAVFQKRIYVSGGRRANGDDSCKVWSNSYTDPKNLFWTGEKALLGGRYCHSMLAVGECLFVIGGYGKRKFEDSSLIVPTRDIEMFCGSTWTLCKPTLSFNPSGAFFAKGNIYIFSGVTKSNTGNYYFEKVCVYSQTSDTFVSEGYALSLDLKEYTSECGVGHRVDDFCQLLFPSNLYTNSV